MTTFGLVHGGFHGAWCWDRLVPQLRARGHDAVTMDLPIDDLDQSLPGYVEAVVEALAAVAGPVILVGHSMGGLVIPHVANRRPVERLVFVCAMFDNLPPLPPGQHDPDVAVPDFDMSMLSFEGGYTSISPSGAAATFYPDCDPADVEWALARLRPQSSSGVTPMAAPWPDVPSTVITCTEDRTRDHSALVVAPRLATEPIILPGGHSPFLSRPDEFADVLDQLAAGSPAAV